MFPMTPLQSWVFLAALTFIAMMSIWLFAVIDATVQRRKAHRRVNAAADESAEPAELVSSNDSVYDWAKQGL